MSETFEGIFVFEDEEHMQKGVELLEAKGILSDVFRYAINYDQKLVVLPRSEYQGLSEIKNDLFEWVDPMHSHLDGIVITDDIQLISWDIHTQSFFELEGMEIAAMFDEQSDKDFFEMPTDGIDGMSPQAFIEKRDALGMQAYYRLPGYIESVRVDNFLQEKLS
ncbi:hypothetical protein [Thiomicrorhabdus indica]|uniref:hypothetical protein n=1 Tax=Thiomicrorhabdus indica TaxID=2267253 RepID=UPI002AA65CC2|nr:hypothetical protein [Thiomicrorhabdus indica]